MKRFYYSAFRDTVECEGIVKAESIDSAREKLILEGYEEISLNILTSPDTTLGCSLDESNP